MLERVWRKGNAFAVLVGIQIGTTLQKTVWRFLKNLRIKLPYDPAIPPLGIYPEETKIEKYMCIPLFTAALFTIARTWKQPRCPLTDEWIKKLWYIYTMEYYSAIKRNAFESGLMRWMNLESLIQSEVSQKEKDKYCIQIRIDRIQKNGTEEFIYREAMEKQTQRIDLWTWVVSLLHQRVDRRSKKKHSLTAAKAKTILQKVSHDEKAECYVPEDGTR